MLIQELRHLGLMHVVELLEEEVVNVAGEKYKRNGQPVYKRWGHQRGSIYIKDQKIPVMVQKVRDMVKSRKVGFSTYERFQ